MEIGIGSLTSQILCKHHNEELSPLDDVGKEFLFAVKSSYDDAFKDGKSTDKTFNIDSNKLELWLLKVLCGITTISPGHTVPNTWIEILFQRRAFPKDSGLYFFGLPGHASWNFNLLRVMSVRNKQGNIAGAKFGIGGLAVLLAFGKPIFEEPEFQSLYRPASLLIQKESYSRRFEFSWKDHQGQGSVKMRIDEIVDQHHKIPRPIVKPSRK